MPNWCENDLTVEGPTEVIEEFLKFAAGESPFDFDRFIPYPEEFRRLDEVAEAWDREHAGRPDYDWRARPKDGFNSGGYDWCVANWGTKWPASRVELEGPVSRYPGKTAEVVFHFDTAWSPPKPVIEKAAKLYPALRFRTPLFRVRLLFQRAFSLQRWRGRDRRVRPVFRRAGRISRSLSRTTAFHASRPPWNGPSSRVKSGGRARPVFRGRGIQSGLP